MKQEDKDLLIKDLCARLPYGVKGLYYSTVMSLHMVDPFVNYHPLYCVTKSGSEYIGIDEFKPYLFPLSSISEEQKKYISDRWGVNEDFDFEIDPNWGEYFIELSDAVGFINWCYENYFDINFLIPKGSALDATGLNIY